MTRDDFIAAIKQANPATQGMADDDIIFEAAKQYEDRGIVDQYPLLKNELAKQRGAIDSRNRGFFGNVKSAAVRGFAQGAQEYNVLQGAEDPTNAQDIADWENIKAKNPISPGFKKFEDASGFIDSAKAFASNPISIMSEVATEGLAGFLPSLAAGEAAASRFGPVGMAAGVGLGSVMSRYSSGLLEILKKHGMDPADPLSVQHFFNDEKSISEAKEESLKEAIPGAIFDAVTAGLAGRFVKPLQEIAKKGGAVAVRDILAATAKEFALQGTGGVAGEASTELMRDGELNGKGLALAGIGALANAPLLVAGNAGLFRSGEHGAPAAPVAPTVPEVEPSPGVRAGLSPNVPEVQKFYAPPPEVVPPAPTPEQVAAAQMQQRIADRARAVRGLDVGDQMAFTDPSMRSAMRTTGEPVIGPLGMPEVPTSAPIADPAQGNLFQHAMDQARARAAQLRGVGVGEQIPFRDPSMSEAMRTRGEPVIGALDTAPDVPYEGSAPGQKRLSFTDKTSATEPAKVEAPKVEDTVVTPPAAEAPVASAVPEKIGNVEAPVSAPAPVALPTTEPFGPKNVVKVLPHDVPLKQIAERTENRVGAVLLGQDKSLTVVPLTLSEDKVPMVVLERKAELGRYKMVDKLADEEAALAKTNTDPNAAFASKSNTNKILFTDQPFKGDQVDPRAIDAMSADPEKQKMYSRIAQRAIDLGWFRREDVLEPLAKYAKENHETVHAQIVADQPLKSGRQPFAGKVEDLSAEPTVAPVQSAVTNADVNKMYDESLRGPTREMTKRNQETAAYLRANVDDKELFRVLSEVANPKSEMPAVERDGLLRKYTGATIDEDPGALRVSLRAAAKAEVFRRNAEKQLGGTAPLATKAAATEVAHVPTKVIEKPVGPIEVLVANDKQLSKLQKAVAKFRQTGDPEVLTKAGVPEHLVPVIEERLTDIAAAKNDKAAIREIFSDILGEKPADMPQQAWDTSTMLRVQPEKVLAARQDLRHPTESDGFRAPGTTASEAKELINNVTYALLRRGLDVAIGEASKDMAAGGQYSPSKRTVSLVLDSVSEPSRQSVLNALHEITHDILETAPEDVKMAFHDFVERMPSGEFAFYHNPEADPRLATGAGLSPEQLTIERGVEHLALLGVDREVSKGVIASIIRAVKASFLQAAVHLQKAFLGEDKTTGRLANAWMENEVSKVIAGDKQVFDGFLNVFGKKPVFADTFRLLHADDGRHYAVKVDITDGTTGYRPTFTLDSLHDDIDAVIEGIKETSKAQGTWLMDRNLKYLDEMMGPDVMKRDPVNFTRNDATLMVQNAKATAESGVAVFNTLKPVFEKVLANVKKVQGDFTEAQRSAARRAGMPIPREIETIDDLHSVLGSRNMDKGTAEAIQYAEDVIKQETGVKSTGDYIDPALTIDRLPTGSVRDAADIRLSNEVTRTRNKVLSKIEAISNEIVKLEENDQFNQATIKAVTENLADSKVTRAALNKSVSDHLRELARDIPRLASTTEALGESSAILEALAKESDRRTLSKKYTERVFDSISVDDLPLNTMVKALYDVANSSGLDTGKSRIDDLRTAVFEHVRTNPSSPLAHLVELGDGPLGKARGTALFSSLLSFMKNEGYTSEVIRIQMSKGTERVNAINELRRVYGEKNERILSALADEVKGFKPTAQFGQEGRPNLTERAAQKLLDARDDALRSQTRLAELRRNRAILDSAKGAFEQLVQASEQRLEKGSAFVLADGGKYLSAGSSDMKSETMRNNVDNNILKLSGPDAMTADAMRDLIGRNQEWLDARKNDPSKQDGVYFSLQRQNAEMARMLRGEKVRDAVSGFRNGSLMGMGETLVRTGTMAGDRLSKAFHQWVGNQRTAAAPSEVRGKKYEVARSRFQKLAGVDLHTLVDQFYEPARWYLDEFQGTEKEAFALIDRKFRSVPELARYWTRKGASEAFFDFIRTARDNKQMQDAWASKVGADRVRDDSLTDKDVFEPSKDKAQERRRLETGVAGYTGPRNLHQDLKNWAASFANKIRGDAEGNIFAALDLKTSIESMRARLGTDLAAMFDDRAWRVFLMPLLTNEHGGVPTPMREDGIRTVVRPSDMHAAIGAAGQDLVKVIDKIYDVYGNKADDAGRQTYTLEALKWVQKEWEFVRDMTGASESQTSSTSAPSVSIPSLGIDARSAKGRPREWFTYPQYTPEDNRRAAHTIFALGAFGRQGEVLNKGLVDLGLEIKAKRSALADYNLPYQTTDHPAWDALKQSNSKEYARLKKIQEYTSPDFQKIMQDIFDTERDLWTQMRTVREVFGGMTVGMVAGLKTSLKNPVSTLNLVHLQRSASPEVMKSVAGAYAKTGRLFFGALAQTLGIDLFKNNELLQTLVRGGAFDAAGHMTLKDHLTGERGIHDNLNPFARTLRIARTVFAHTRLSPLDKGGTAPSLRLLNPFQFTQQLVNMGNSWQLMEVVRDMASKGAEVYRNDPKSVRALTAKDVGMSDNTAFEARRALLADNGISLEDLAAKYAKGRNILDDKLTTAINNISTGGLANESSLLNRPLFMSRSKTAQMAGTFIGWGLDQTNKTARLLETADGRLNVNSMARGLAVLGIGVMPASLAYAALLDHYDELIEKKQNRVPVSSGPSAYGEALASVGTLGLFGDLTDAITSNRQSTSGWADSLSLDNRIVILSSARSLVQATRNLLQVGPGEANYANIGRPFLMGLGANGIMQNAYILDRILGNRLQEVPGIGGLIKSESDLALRGNLYNYLRVAGREADIEVKAQGGGGYTITPMTPHITDMSLAALRNDPQEFQSAFKAAIQAAQRMGYLDPMTKVQQAFAQRQPLRVLFNGTPMIGEVSKMLQSMPEAGRDAVMHGIQNFNAYAMSLGADPFMGAEDFDESQYRRVIQREDPVDLVSAARAKASQMYNRF